MLLNKKKNEKKQALLQRQYRMPLGISFFCVVLYVGHTLIHSSCCSGSNIKLKLEEKLKQHNQFPLFLLLELEKREKVSTHSSVECIFKADIIGLQPFKDSFKCMLLKIYTTQMEVWFFVSFFALFCRT